MATESEGLWYDDRREREFLWLDNPMGNLQ
jgi:hypothetical protein